MDTSKRMIELAEERQLSLYQLAQTCDIPYSTLKNSAKRGNQLNVVTIENLCKGLGIKLTDFFADEDE